MNRTKHTLYNVLTLAVNTSDGIKTPVRVHWFTSRSRKSFLCIVRATDAERRHQDRRHVRNLHGRGKATGTGYDLMGAAFVAACESAGMPAPREGFGADDTAWQHKILHHLGYRGKYKAIWAL